MFVKTFFVGFYKIGKNMAFYARFLFGYRKLIVFVHCIKIPLSEINKKIKVDKFPITEYNYE